MSNISAWVENLFGSSVEIGEKPVTALEAFEEQYPQVHMQCNGCDKLTREIRLKNGLCEKCRGIKVVDGGLAF